MTNPITGESEDPDESMMSGVEDLLGVDEGGREDFRSAVISRIAAWAIENKGQQLVVRGVLPDHLKRLRDAYFERNRGKVVETVRAALAVLDEDDPPPPSEARAAGETLINELVERHGYCRSCARDALARILSRRFEQREGGA